jgi:CDP-diacylglycerol--inositol 3-phosphatidyltransferase
MKWDHSPMGLTILPPFGTFASKLCPGILEFIASLTFAQMVALITFPICFGKNVINIVQGWKASKILVGIDLAERTEARMAKRDAKH